MHRKVNRCATADRSQDLGGAKTAISSRVLQLAAHRQRTQHAALLPCTCAPSGPVPRCATPLQLYPPQSWQQPRQMPPTRCESAPDAAPPQQRAALLLRARFVTLVILVSQTDRPACIHTPLPTVVDKRNPSSHTYSSTAWQFRMAVRYLGQGHRLPKLNPESVKPKEGCC
jgi:hypothetical protein